jgi:copper transport protein
VLRKIAFIAVLVVGWLFGTAPDASAHAELVSTVPTNGGHLATAPDEVLLVFSEPIALVRGGFGLLDDQGRSLGEPHVDVDGVRARVALPDSLGDGAYVVTWRVVSADSHPVHGAFVFSVGSARAAPVADGGARDGADPLVGLVFWLCRGLGYASLALLVGGAFFLAACLPKDRRTRRLLTIAWSVALGSSIAVLLLQGPNAAGSPLGSAVDPALIGDTVRSGYGILVLARIGVLCAAPLVLRAIGRLSRRDGAILVLALGFGLDLTWSGTGHASVGSMAFAVIAVDASHLLATAAWLGGLAVLAGCVLAGGADRPPAEVAVATAWFSRTALVSVLVLVASGVVLAVRELTASGALIGSRYAELLLFKLAAFGVLLCLAAVSRSVVRAVVAKRPRRRADHGQDEVTRRLRRSVAGETAIAAVVLGLAAALVATPPTARDREPGPVAERSGPYLGSYALPDTGDVQVWVEPATAGDNQVAINVRDERGINRNVPEVSAHLELAARGVGPLPVSLVRTGPGQFVADKVAIPSAGAWQLVISVRTTEFDRTTVDTEVPVR